MMGIGLVGVTMNPAMVTRVQRTGNARPLVNTVHSSFITLGIILGSSIGAVVIEGWGLRAPLWLGATMALIGLATLLPDLAGLIGRRRGTGNVEPWTTTRSPSSSATDAGSMSSTQPIPSASCSS
jgi:MFS family permease